MLDPQLAESQSIAVCAPATRNSALVRPSATDVILRDANSKVIAIWDLKTARRGLNLGEFEKFEARSVLGPKCR